MLPPRLYMRGVFLHALSGNICLIIPKSVSGSLKRRFDVDMVEDVDFFVRANATYDGFQEKDSLLIRRSLQRYPLVACCSPQYAERYWHTANPLKSCPSTTACLPILWWGGTNGCLSIKANIRRLKSRGRLKWTDSEIIKSIALTGGGIAYLPLMMLRDELADGKLISILGDYLNAEFELNLYYRQRKQMPLLCTNFKDYMIKRTREIGELEP